MLVLFKSSSFITVYFINNFIVVTWRFNKQNVYKMLWIFVPVFSVTVNIVTICLTKPCNSFFYSLFNFKQINVFCSLHSNYNSNNVLNLKNINSFTTLKLFWYSLCWSQHSITFSVLIFKMQKFFTVSVLLGITSWPNTELPFFKFGCLHLTLALNIAI